MELEKLPVDMYATYGMTETVSHVALRRIGDSLSLYCALGGISFSIDERNCLIIHAPHFSVKEFDRKENSRSVYTPFFCNVL